MRDIFKIRRPESIGVKSEYGWFVFNKNMTIKFVVGAQTEWLTQISAMMEVSKTDTIYVEADHGVTLKSQTHVLSNIERVSDQEW